MTLYALILSNGSVERYQGFDGPPPQLAAEKGLRWLPVADELPDLGAGEVLGLPTTTVGSDGVRRIWAAAAPPPPAVVSPLQMRLALRAAGLIDPAATAIEQLGPAEQDAWEYATEIRRDSPLVALIAAALGIDDAALDALFRTAAAITV